MDLLTLENPHKWNHTIRGLLCLVSFTHMMFSRFAYVVACFRLSPCFRFFGETYLGVEVVILGLTYCGTASPFSVGAAPFYIPTTNVQGFQSLLHISKTYYFLCFFFLFHFCCFNL